MNTSEIDRFLRRRLDRFDGVFSVDTLPSEPHLLIANTEPSHRPGEHWIAIYVDDRGRGENFDSFGRPPTGAFRRYMDEHCANWTCNDRQLQSIVSRFCGHYCIYFCMLRSRDVDLRRIVSSFTSDTGFNDVLVHAFVCGK
jgi:hypothetical protein